MRESSPAISARMVAPTILGQRCWVRWPYLQEAVVQAVSDASERVRPPSDLLLYRLLTPILCKMPYSSRAGRLQRVRAGAPLPWTPVQVVCPIRIQSHTLTPVLHLHFSTAVLSHILSHRP